MTTSEEAEKSVNRFFDNAKEQILDRFEQSLRKISKMPWWERLFKASDEADKALGTGKYWDKEQLVLFLLAIIGGLLFGFVIT